MNEVILTESNLSSEAESMLITAPEEPWNKYLNEVLNIESFLTRPYEFSPEIELSEVLLRKIESFTISSELDIERIPVPFDM